jgi:mannose-1-phosphate guanylyltransferase
LIYGVILAGGSGTRLWPRSRAAAPKQLLDILSEKTMLQETVDRLQPLIPPERLLVMTGAVHAPMVGQQVPQIPLENIVVEPYGHNTAPAVGLAAIRIRQRDPDGVMAIFSADHSISRAGEFRQIVAAAGRVAERGSLVTLGILPGRPETGYGYIERGALHDKVDGREVFYVEHFLEKPDQAKAEEYVASGNYFWNAGIFIWKVSTIMEEFARHMPQLHGQLLQMERVLGRPNEDEVINQIWSEVEDQSIDYGIMEHARDVMVIPTSVGWSDVGDWAALLSILPRDERDNVVLGPHVSLDTEESLIYGRNRLIATIGLRDMIVVDTDDVVLVCHRSRAQEVKKLVDRLRAQGETEFL